MGLIFHETYKGERFSYGMRNRPFGCGCQPAGFIVSSHRGDARFTHGVIDYPFELSPKQVLDFELEPLIEWKSGSFTHRAEYHGLKLLVANIRIGQRVKRPTTIGYIGGRRLICGDFGDEFTKRHILQRAVRLAAFPLQ